MLPLLVWWSLTHDTSAFIAYAFPVLLCFTWKTSPKEPRPSRFTNSKELGPTWSPAQRSAVLVPADQSENGPFVEVLPPPPMDTVSIPVNGIFIKNTGWRTKFRANLVYQCLYPQIFPIFSHSPSPLASCPGASAQKVGHVRWFWEWSHSSRLGSVWVNPWERRPDRWDGHDAFEIQSESLKQIKCIIYIYI